MNRTFLCVLLTLSFLPYKSFSQNATLSGHLSGIDEGKYVYLTAYPLGQSYVFRDSAKIKKGGFTLHLSIPDGEGTIYYFSSVPMEFGEEGNPADPINFTHRWQLIYLQAGRAVVNGDANYLDNAEYSGDPFMQDENDYFIKQRANAPWKRFINRLNDAYARGENVHGSHALKEDSAGKDMMVGAITKIQIAEKWVTAHLNSPYSTVVIYKDITVLFGKPAEEKAKYFHQLTPAARNNKPGKFLVNWVH